MIGIYYYTFQKDLAGNMLLSSLNSQDPRAQSSSPKKKNKTLLKKIGREEWREGLDHFKSSSSYVDALVRI